MNLKGYEHQLDPDNVTGALQWQRCLSVVLISKCYLELYTFLKIGITFHHTEWYNLTVTPYSPIGYWMIISGSLQAPTLFVCLFVCLRERKRGRERERDDSVKTLPTEWRGVWKSALLDTFAYLRRCVCFVLFYFFHASSDYAVL